MSDAPSHPADRSSGADSVQRFAADLRHLRLDAESPTLARLQSDTGISKTVLSEAFAGRSVPSARTVDGIVRALGGDSRAWLARRDDLLSPQPSEESTAPTEDARSRGVSRRSAAWIAAAAFVVGVVASAAVTLALVPVVFPPEAAGADGPAGPRIVVENGENPALTPCVDDARVATGDTRADNSLLEIVWSDACQAGWGRITRYDGLGNGNTVTIAIYPQTAPDGPDRQEATEHDVQGAYTHLVVRPSPDTLLCAEGSFTVDGTRVDLGDPLCI